MISDDEQRSPFHKEDPRHRGCCSLNVVKFAFSVFCVIYCLAGVLQISSSLWTLRFHRLHFAAILDLSPSPIFPLMAWVLMAGGISNVLASIVGFIGAKTERRRLVTYCLLLTFVALVLELVSALLSYVLHNSAQSELEPGMTIAVMVKYGEDDRITEALDEIQQQLKCCGSEFYQEWLGSSWYFTRSKKNSVPESCCKSPSYNCGISTHPSNIPYTGCIHSLSTGLEEWSSSLAIVSLGCAVLTLAGLIYACILSVRLRKFKRDVEEAAELRRRRLATRPVSGGLFDRPRHQQPRGAGGNGYHHVHADDSMY